MSIAAMEFLAACTGAASTPGASASGSTNTSVGSNYSDPVPVAAFAAVVAAYEKQTGHKVSINTVSHNAFQQNINNYLQGAPNPVFTWFSGIRMQSYAKSGLTTPIDDVWAKIGGNFSTAVTKASTAADGKKYLVPWVTYPWAVFYSKSLFSSKGYAVPTTWDQYKALCVQMKKDGITPIAFADKDLWPACGTFDYINMRLNGYQFHEDLMAHRESWDQQKVKSVFDTWKEILPYVQPGALGRTWQDAANSIGAKTSGMMVAGLTQIGALLTGSQYDDLDFFPFPQISPEYGQDAVEAPIDGFMMSTKGKGSVGAVDFLEYLGTGSAQLTFLGANKSAIATAKGASTTGYSPLQMKALSLINGAKQLSQFLDRDSLPAFASNVMEPAIQTFISSGTFDTKTVEAQAAKIYATGS